MANYEGACTTFAPAVSPPIYYSLDEKGIVDFIACHPYRDGVTDYVYPVDVSSRNADGRFLTLFSELLTWATRTFAIFVSLYVIKQQMNY